MQQDKKIVVIGTAKVDGLSVFALIRYFSDGTIDRSFGHEGIVTSCLQEGTPCKAHAAALQSDGKLIVAGFSHKKLALVRYFEDGTRDTTFTFDTTHISASEHDSKIVGLSIQTDMRPQLALMNRETLVIIDDTTHTSSSHNAPSLQDRAVLDTGDSQNSETTHCSDQPAIPCMPCDDNVKSNSKPSLQSLIVEGVLVAGGTYIVIQSIRCFNLVYMAGRITGVISPRKIRQSLREQRRRLGFDINK